MILEIEETYLPKKGEALAPFPGEEYDPLCRALLEQSAPFFALLQEGAPASEILEKEKWDPSPELGEDLSPLFFEIVAPLAKLLIPWHRKRRKKGKRRDSKED